MSSVQLRVPLRKNFQFPNIPRGLDDDFHCTGFIRSCTVVVTNVQHRNKLYYSGGYGNIYWQHSKGKKILWLSDKERRERSNKDGASSENDTVDLSSNAKHTNFDVLQLSLMDAFHLVHVVKCLTVYDENKAILNANALWVRCCRQEVNFIPLYVAYYHFRKKGWVVKSGLKYGTDYTLYKVGPEYYHSTYSVVVQYVVGGKLTKESREFKWHDFSALCRITEQVSKDLLFSYVVQPKNITGEELMSPDCVPRHEVQEALIRRWTCLEERESEAEEISA